MTVELPEITRAAALRIEPGDTLFFTVGEELSFDEADHVKAYFDAQFPGVKCVLLIGGLDLAEVHKADA